jgi:uncharacterized protein YegP (UPF0339 family)
MSGWLREQIVRLGSGNETEREAALHARRAFAYAAQVGPYQIAADYGAASDATLAQIAHGFATGAGFPLRFVDLVAQSAEQGFVFYLSARSEMKGITFEGVREICAEWGPWPLAEGERTAREIADALADRNPELDRPTVIAAALLGTERRRPEFETFRDIGGGWRWRLIARNGEIVAQSEAYGSESDAERGANDAREAAVKAVIIGKARR